MRHALLDMGMLITSLAACPTHISELVHNPLDYIGYCDASAFGAGGVWFGGQRELKPLVWRVEWPADVAKSIVSESNPLGTITNSDLEMAGVLLHELVLEAAVGTTAMARAQLAIRCDNSPVVAWTRRMATCPARCKDPSRRRSCHHCVLLPPPGGRIRTVQFRIQDVKFRTADGTVIPNSAPVAVLQQAKSVTLWLDNQKNGQRGATIHHTRCDADFCLVPALARRVSDILAQGCPPSTPLSFVSPGIHVVAANITTLVHHAATATNLVAHGYSLRCVGTHSLRASGVMALKLQGVDDSTMMKIGRWTGLTFTTYIHSQIGALNTGMARRMATRVDFVNVAT
jgi:hypothetical protein